jgi:hypothetical protein
MPHWSCHYYRLETGSSFVVGSWEFSRLDSAVSLLIYTVLIVINLVAVAGRWQLPTALLSGLLHFFIGSLHAYRLVVPFRFEVFGHDWPPDASLREVIVVVPFGLLSLWVARLLKHQVLHHHHDVDPRR